MTPLAWFWFIMAIIWFGLWLQASKRARAVEEWAYKAMDLAAEFAIAERRWDSDEQ